MRLRPEQLNAQLQKQLLPAYLITGDELLIQQESADALRHQCREQGILEREVLEVDRSFNWSNLLEAGQSMSLFAERKLIELRLNNSGMDQKSSAVLQQFLEMSDGSNILLMTCGKLDSRSMNAKWVKAIDSIGAVVQIWPVDRRQLGPWIQQRLKANGMSADREAAELLADRVEGNLLAADQEIQKLKILVGEKAINVETVASAVASSARYDIFKLIDAALAGRAAQALHMLDSLLAEGGEEIAMLGALCRELRNLSNCAQQMDQGTPLERALDAARVWDKRKEMYRGALQRLSLRKLQALLVMAAEIDRAQKGQSDANSQLLMRSLVSALGGQPLPGRQRI